jgi:hypothetical protein
MGNASPKSYGPGRQSTTLLTKEHLLRPAALAQNQQLGEPTQATRHHWNDGKQRFREKVLGTILLVSLQAMGRAAMGR